MYWDKVHNRLAPDAGPEHFKSYSARAPLATHWRPATCEEAECEHFLHGFVLSVDLSTDLGQKQYHYVTKEDKERSYSIQRISMDLVKVVYGPGNPCFEPYRSQHRVPIGRPPFYLVADGDFRGNPRGTPVRRHFCVEDWVDDFANHQDKVSTVMQRG
jgi:hypothetical protein